MYRYKAVAYLQCQNNGSLTNGIYSYTRHPTPDNKIMIKVTCVDQEEAMILSRSLLAGIWCLCLHGNYQNGTLSFYRSSSVPGVYPCAGALLPPDFCEPPDLPPLPGLAVLALTTLSAITCQCCRRPLSTDSSAYCPPRSQGRPSGASPARRPVYQMPSRPAT